jgi:hypothetical protein
MFDSDSDNDMEFEGFQEDWSQNNFASRLPSRFNTQRKQRPIIIMNCSGVTIYGKNWWIKQTGTPNKSAERTPFNRRLQTFEKLQAKFMFERFYQKNYTFEV